MTSGRHHSERSVVVPAKNEAPSLEHLFGTILAWVDEIVLVDGHSTDDTVGSLRSRTLQLTSSTSGAVKRGIPLGRIRGSQGRNNRHDRRRRSSDGGKVLVLSPH